MKIKQKKSAKSTLSDKIADALTVKPRADIEDDQVFGTKPQTLTKNDFGSSGSEDETAISDFRKRNINLLSEISNKYEGKVVSRKEIEGSESEGNEDSDSESGAVNLSEIGISLSNNNSDSDVSEDYDKDQKTVCKSTQKQKRETSLSFTNQDSDSEGAEISAKKKIVSKPLLKQKSDSEDFSSGGESDDYSIMQDVKKQIQSSSYDEDEESNESDEDRDSGDDEESGEEEGEGYDISQMEEPMKEEFEHVKKQNVSEEAKKGACVRNQLLIWEGLLEMRIHLQRCMNTANQMPMPVTHAEFQKDDQFAEQCNLTKSNITAVLDKFLTLQNILLKKYPETKSISNKKEENDSKEGKTKKKEEEDDDEEIPSDTDNEEIPSDTEEEDNTPEETAKQTSNTLVKKRKLEEYEKDISVSHKSFKPFRDSTINKWNEKTRIATASVIKNKNLPTNTVLQQIEYILSDREKLVKRTQLKRTEYDIIGYKKPVIDEQEQNGTEIPKTKDRKDDDEYISEIFDDSDFYHQLLRELIECKSADISDPVQLSRQWIALQQMRSKMKRKVDTKATKGRKIKYVVHNKLVNYMAPEKCTTWTDESTNELYSSLFGKIFEHNNAGLNANLENDFKLKN